MKRLLAFLDLHQHVKNQFIPSIHSSDTDNFRVLLLEWTHPLLTKPTQQNVKSTFNFLNLYQHAESEAILSPCFEDTADLKILKFD